MYMHWFHALVRILVHVVRVGCNISTDVIDSIPINVAGVNDRGIYSKSKIIQVNIEANIFCFTDPAVAIFRTQTNMSDPSLCTVVICDVYRSPEKVIRYWISGGTTPDYKQRT